MRRISGTYHSGVRGNTKKECERIFVVRNVIPKSHTDHVIRHEELRKEAEMERMNIPVGVSDFEEIRKNGYYYIDKSGLIEELLSRTGTKVTLITRPRRFGKTLGMSMLENFFDIRKDSRKLFEGLEIAEHQILCDGWMNQYPMENNIQHRCKYCLDMWTIVLEMLL